MTGSTITLRDGRALGYASWGDPAGEVVLQLHGSPGSRLDHPIGAMAVPGVRYVTVDRPGMGRSSPMPGRTLVDWADDVRSLADALGLDRFVVQGVSGGGPSAAACAAVLGEERVRAVGLVCTAGDPGAHDVCAGMNPMNAGLFDAVRSDPASLRTGLEMMAASMADDPVSVMRAGMRSAGGPDAEAASDDELLAVLAASAREAFAQGVDGVLRDLELFVTPWGFDIGRVGAVPCVVAHGTEDTNVPFHNGEWLAAAVPGSVFLRHEGEGHLSLLTRHGAAITTALLDVAR